MMRLASLPGRCRGGGGPTQLGRRGSWKCRCPPCPDDEAPSPPNREMVMIYRVWWTHPTQLGGGRWEVAPGSWPLNVGQQVDVAVPWPSGRDAAAVHVANGRRWGVSEVAVQNPSIGMDIGGRPGCHELMMPRTTLEPRCNRCWVGCVASTTAQVLDRAD